MADSMDAICDDLAAEHAASTRSSLALMPTPAGSADAGGRMDRPRLRSATCGSSTSGRCWRSPTPTRSRADAEALLAASATGDPTVARGRAMRPAPSCSTTGGPGARRCSTCSRALDPKARVAVVRTGDGRPLVRHGAADGDVGARPGRRRRRRRQPAADRPPAPRRPHRRAGPAVQLRDQRPSSCPTATWRRLDAPERGEPWTWGRRRRTDRVTGPALDFCLVVTQRRHLDDTALVDRRARRPTSGSRIAQAFAGPPGEGRRAGSVRQQIESHQLEQPRRRPTP